MTFEDFFNARNVEHLVAFQYLQEHGSWPVDFISNEIELPLISQQVWIMLNDMAKAWIEIVKFHNNGLVKEFIINPNNAKLI